MSDNDQLTIDGTALENELTIETSGRVIRPFNRLIGEVVDEYRITATDDGLHVRAVDAPNVMYVDATLPAAELDALSLEGEEVVTGVGVSHFKSALSDARYGTSTDDPVSLTSDGATLKAEIERDYAGVPAQVTNHAELINPDSLRAEPDKLEHDCVSFQLPPDAFREVVSSLDGHNSRGANLRVADGTAMFATADDTRTRQIELDVDASGSAEAHYSLDYLKTIADGLKTSYAETATLALDDEYPLTVRFETEQGIKAEYTVAPRVQRD